MPRPRSRRPVITIIAVAVAVSMLSPIGVARAGQCWRAPVEAPISDPFRAPACRWCPGNRGIEYDTSRGAEVTAVAAGVITFAGSVAGTGYVVIRHADGLRATYGNVSFDNLHVGDLVVRGMRVGSTTGRLHLGVRRGGSYIDPTPLIGSLVFTPRLIPANDDRATPAPTPRLRCPP
jgi:murein DD-endopeptidase MepM/ murein hydrolase activator NlpD